MKITRITPLLLTLIGTGAHAQFANNTAIWSITPSTQANGIVNDNLVLTAIPSGLIVTGTWQVTLPPGPQAGILL